MSERYRPQIQSASIPENGAWANMEDQVFLILSLPEWDDVVTQNEEGFQYVWMYDRNQDAYIFCFRLDNGAERAIAFPKDHAGVLLQDEKASQEFSMMITAKDLNEANEEDSFLILPKIRLVRHPKAGW